MPPLRLSCPPAVHRALRAAYCCRSRASESMQTHLHKGIAWASRHRSHTDRRGVAGSNQRVRPISDGYMGPWPPAAIVCQSMPHTRLPSTSCCCGVPGAAGDWQFVSLAALIVQRPRARHLAPGRCGPTASITVPAPRARAGQASWPTRFRQLPRRFWRAGGATRRSTARCCIPAARARRTPRSSLDR